MLGREGRHAPQELLERVSAPRPTPPGVRGELEQLGGRLGKVDEQSPRGGELLIASAHPSGEEAAGRLRRNCASRFRRTSDWKFRL